MTPIGKQGGRLPFEGDRPLSWLGSAAMCVAAHYPVGTDNHYSSATRGGWRISNLCQASLEDIQRYVDDRVLQKRAWHVVTEHLRTRMAADLLRQGKVPEIGTLMVESHGSLRDEYEVTGPELDALVEAALRTKGCAGARMTGAGFGGCALALVQSDCLESFIEQVSRVYHRRMGLSAVFYLCKFGDGVGEVT